MDSRVETYQHIQTVQFFMNKCIKDLQERSLVHDQSKLFSPEVEVFNEVTVKLKRLTYESEEYFLTLKDMKPALDHHYSHNRHHPEFHKNGVKDMNLLDLLEMLCDWTADCRRHPDGDILKSIEINAERFGYSDELKQILTNTVHYLRTGR